MTQVEINEIIEEIKEYQNSPNVINAFGAGAGFGDVFEPKVVIGNERGVIADRSYEIDSFANLAAILNGVLSREDLSAEHIRTHYIISEELPIYLHYQKLPKGM